VALTTIAYKKSERLLVADSLCSEEEYLAKTYTTKIIKTDEGIAGASGGAWAGHVFFAWLQGDASKEDFENLDVGDDFTGLFIDWKGEISFYNRYLIPDIASTEFVAIGCGAKIAYALMDYGASAYEAVRLSCKYDLYTGGDIVTIKLEK